MFNKSQKQIPHHSLTHISGETFNAWRVGNTTASGQIRQPLWRVTLQYKYTHQGTWTLSTRHKFIFFNETWRWNLNVPAVRISWLRRTWVTEVVMMVPEDHLLDTSSLIECLQRFFLVLFFFFSSLNRWGEVVFYIIVFKRTNLNSS